MGSRKNKPSMKNRAIAVIATGEYNQFIPTLVKSANKYFKGHIYLFTDQPLDAPNLSNITVMKIEHYGFPKMPLMRWEIFRQYKDVFEEAFIFCIDADTEFIRPIDRSVNGYRVAVMHRNITRYREDFNYESRKDSTAYVSPEEGEKYYACGFCGGRREEFIRMCEVLSNNIKKDVKNGIRAIWGDESHLNRYLIDNKPTLTLPPNFMCPSTNPYFVPYIQHQNKDFKKVNKEDTEKLLTVNYKDYEDLI